MRIDVEWRELDNDVQGGSNLTGTNCDLFTHKSFRSYLNHLVFITCLPVVIFGNKY
jgi:hypothetical protein